LRGKRVAQPSRSGPQNTIVVYATLNLAALLLLVRGGAPITIVLVTAFRHLCAPGPFARLL
jgi:hypothetical protein